VVYIVSYATFLHKLIQQHWNNSTGPLGLVVKRITSMTSESANDKIARSIRAEGILFCRASFCFALKRITYYSGVELIISLVRFWRRTSFCVGGVHFELGSAELPTWKGSNVRSTCFCTKTIAKYNGCFKGTHVYSTWPVCKHCIARACATGLYVTRDRTASMFFP
jgi:hypothetical protein